MNDKNIEEKASMYNKTFKPFSHSKILIDYKRLREVDEERDKNYSPLHDSILTAISSNLKEYASEAYDRAWSSSLFPERLTKEILRLCEEQMENTLTQYKEALRELVEKINMLTYSIVEEEREVNNDFFADTMDSLSKAKQLLNNE